MNEASFAVVDLDDQPPSSLLVVEDDPLIRFAISDYLRHCGYHVVEVVSASEAMIVLQAPAPTIDLVFSEVHLPGEFDGIDLARWVNSVHPGLPVILTSGVAQTTDLGELICTLGPLERKPYNEHSLAQRISRTLEGTSRGPSVTINRAINVSA